MKKERFRICYYDDKLSRIIVDGRKSTKYFSCSSMSLKASRYVQPFSALTRFRVQTIYFQNSQLFLIKLRYTLDGPNEDCLQLVLLEVGWSRR